MSVDRHEDAAVLFQRAAAMAPENDELMFWSGLAAAQGGDLATALDRVRAAAGLNPRWLELLERLGPEIAPAAADVRAALRQDLTRHEKEPTWPDTRSQTSRPTSTTWPRASASSPDLEAHFARQTLGDGASPASATSALAPGFRIPFGHTHAKQEETYVILSGSGRAKVDDEVVEVKALDALRVAPGTWRGMEAGPDGIELIAFGARPGMAQDENDTEMEQGWWED